MFGVLIVDDEEPVLDSYEFMLDKFRDGPADSPFMLAGKARSGYEALKLIYETEPDLVFMDINIPGIDGLSVLEEVHKKYPRMVCILSTAYERFDLAQRAIPLGVFAYLVKPVSKKTFFATLESALLELRSHPPEPFSEEPRLRLLRRDIWKEMTEETWEGYRSALSLPSGRALVMMVEIEEDQEAWCAKIAEGLSFRYHCLYDVMMNRGFFLVSASETRELFLRRWEEIAAALFPGDLAWFSGSGDLYPGPELYRSCNEALAELESRRSRTGAGERERLMVIRLRQKIGVAPPEESRELFTHIWETAFTGTGPEAAGSPAGGTAVGAEIFRAARARMISLFTLFLDDIAGTWSETGGTLPVNPAEIAGLEDSGAWKRWAEPNFEKLLLLAVEKRSGRVPLPLAKALGFIREHYAEGIQLGDAAENAGVSTAHLSRLFTEGLKTNFVDYLTELRLCEAERLLRESSLSIKEIAHAVGYQDPAYFSKIFKRIRGILPTEAAHLPREEKGVQ